MRAHGVLGNGQRLDGGAMFGNAPRQVWKRWAPPDEQGRIELACRGVLIDEGERKVLLETGIGAFFEPNMRDRFGVTRPEHVLLQSLGELGLTHEDVDVVVLSHLHFDHAGGLLSAWQQERPPELLFPNATFVVGAEAFERAQHPHQRDRASFIPGLVEKLQQSGRLSLVDSARSDALGDRYSFERTHGHTPGMLHTTVRGDKASLFYGADLMPGIPWMHVPITMGYDRFPEQLVDEKLAVLQRLERDDTWLFFAHDPRAVAAQVKRDDRGRYGAGATLHDQDVLSLSD